MEAFITYCYQVITAMISVIFMYLILKQEDITEKLIGVIVLLPFLLRTFLIK